MKQQDAIRRDESTPQAAKSKRSWRNIAQGPTPSLLVANED